MIVRFHRIRKILIENCHALFGCGHYLHRFLFCLLCNLDFLGVIRIPILRIPSSLSSSGRGTSISFTRRISSFFAKSSFKSTQLELWKHQREREKRKSEWVWILLESTRVGFVPVMESPRLWSSVRSSSTLILLDAILEGNGMVSVILLTQLWILKLPTMVVAYDAAFIPAFDIWYEVCFARWNNM